MPQTLSPALIDTGGRVGPCEIVASTVACLQRPGNCGLSPVDMLSKIEHYDKHMQHTHCLADISAKKVSTSLIIHVDQFDDLCAFRRVRVIEVEVDDVHCSLSKVDRGTDDQPESDPDQLISGAPSLGERAEVRVAWFGVRWPD